VAAATVVKNCSHIKDGSERNQINSLLEGNRRHSKHLQEIAASKLSFKVEKGDGLNISIGTNHRRGEGKR